MKKGISIRAYRFGDSQFMIDLLQKRIRAKKRLTKKIA